MLPVYTVRDLPGSYPCCDRARTEKLLRKWRKRDAAAAGDDVTPAEDIIEMLNRIAGQKAATRDEEVARIDDPKR